ncbi:STAS domain-containing protein [candidate division CSSED10-310 bacterium]|uniref:Anti-sigma factor antagonist n=1 Tax=candidate division CSSED10-310 bacterium TaxID=2855610 RepID=A0ABV6YSM7_UNCC1
MSRKLNLRFDKCNELDIIDKYFRHQNLIDFQERGFLLMEQEEQNFPTEIRENCLVLFLDGEITNLCEKSVFAAYDEAIQADVATIILDFEKVRYINSAGIAVFINLLKKVRQKQQNLFIANLSDYFRKIFTMIGLTRYSKCYQTLDQAIADSKGLKISE